MQVHVMMIGALDEIQREGGWEGRMTDERRKKECCGVGRMEDREQLENQLNLNWRWHLA